jgi:translation initiation factor IF-1
MEVSGQIDAHSIWLNKIDKVKVKLSLCFNWAPRHGGVLGEWKYSATHSLTSALDGGEYCMVRL